MVKKTATVSGRVSGNVMNASNTPKSADADLLREMEQDAKSKVVQPDLLKRITEKARELATLQKTALRLEAQVEQNKQAIRQLEEQTLPALLDEAQVRDLALLDGSKLERQEEVYASISKANQGDAIEWLLKNNYGSIVKARIVVEVERGDVTILEAARKALAKARIAFEESGGVHSSTLKAFVRERLKDGKKLPKSITHHVQPRVVIEPADKILRPGKAGK